MKSELNWRQLDELNLYSVLKIYFIFLKLNQSFEWMIYESKFRENGVLPDEVT